MPATCAPVDEAEPAQAPTQAEEPTKVEPAPEPKKEA
jgi:hypothetical protein